MAIYRHNIHFTNCLLTKLNGGGFHIIVLNILGSQKKLKGRNREILVSCLEKREVFLFFFFSIRVTSVLKKMHQSNHSTHGSGFRQTKA